MAVEKPEKKDKKERKRSEESGVGKPKKEKKDKKEKKEKLAAALDEKLQQDAAAQVAGGTAPAAAPSRAHEADSDAEIEVEKKQKAELPLERTIVPFALPVADEKGMKKTYKSVRKAAKNNTLKRGVKEVVKTLRKSASSSSAPGNSNSNSSSSSSFPGIVIIAGDISPQDVISHIPVLCEDHGVPYIFVTSRAELGAAAKTKRPTSVVMIMAKPEGGKKKDSKKAADAEGENDDGEDYGEVYAALVKYVQKEYGKQAFWIKGEVRA